MTMRVKVNFKISCPRHRRYDPAQDGEAGIKGGCPICALMLGLHQQSLQLIENAGAVAVACRPGIDEMAETPVPEPAPKKAKAARAK
jgi:hypothetical protein